MASPISPLISGPQPLTRQERLATIDRLVESILNKHGDRVLAIGLYGSMAREADQPYSDIEMLCVLNTYGDDHSYEWVYGPGKAEINFMSRAVALKHAAELDERWPLTHGAFASLKPLYGDGELLRALKRMVFAHSNEEFNALIREIIVGDVCEYVGKLRNARHMGKTANLARLACQIVESGAYLIGLMNRSLYTTNSTLLEESLSLPNRPAGYDDLCRRVMRGELADSEAVSAEIEKLWIGIVEWAEKNQVGIEERCRDPF
jgi:kanamycin nucleotidyltransferase